MSGNDHQIFFCIAPIQDAVFRQGDFSPGQLFQAALVNRAWHAMITPYLWEHTAIDFNKVSRDQDRDHYSDIKTGFLSSSRWIKTLATNQERVLKWVVESADLTGLIALDYHPEKITSNGTKLLLRIMVKNTRLQSFRCHPELNSGWKLSAITNGLTNLTMRLTNLDVLVANAEGHSLCKVLNSHANSITTLTVNEFNLVSGTLTDLEPLCQLRTLTWDQTDTFLQSVVYPCEALCDLITVAPNIEDLTLVTGNSLLANQLPSLLRDGLLNIKVLKLEISSHGKSWTDGQVSDFLEALSSKMRVLEVTGACIGRRSNVTLSRLAASGTLTVLNLKGCSTISDRTVQTILTTFPKLIEIRADGQTPVDVVVMKSAWVCTELKRLEMSFLVGYRSLMGTLNDDIGVVEAERMVIRECEQLFGQLGRLKKLQTIEMNIGAPKLKLTKLYISENHINRVEVGVKQVSRSGTVSLIDEELSTVWERLSSCVHVKSISVYLYFPLCMVDPKQLRIQSQSMWGSQTKVQIELYS